MATFLLENAGASVTGDPVKFNGGKRVLHVQATSYGTASGVTIEGRIDSSLSFVPLTYANLPAAFTANSEIAIELTPNGQELRAVTDTGCSGVTVAILPTVSE